MKKLEQLIRDWGDEELNRTNLRLQTLEQRLYRSYEPSLPPNPQFWTRLEKWLESVPADASESKKTLFRLAASLFYVGPDEFLELYRFAYNGPIARWLIDQCGIDICSPTAGEDLQIAAADTWFCPISDSMRISSFYHVNNIAARADLRSDWRSLAHFTDPTQILKYCLENGFKRVVLLEDFVGSGSQMVAAVEHAAKLSPQIKTLVVPLIICPAGVETLASLELSHAGALRFEPILSIPKTAFVSLVPVPNEPHLHRELRDLAARTYNLVSDGKAIGPHKPYHPLGFPHESPSGGLIVMFSNTPDNTLPLVHWPSGQWSPLFPRHSRV